MRIDRSTFNSVIAWRFFVLFVISALVPTAILAVFAYRHVSKQLYEQSELRLRQATKAEGLSVYERLLFLRSELDFVGQTLGSSDHLDPESKLVNSRTEALYEAVGVARETRDLDSVYGSVPYFPELNSAQYQQLENGGVVLVSFEGGDESASVAMVRRLDLENPQVGLLIGIPRSEYLWGSDGSNTVPPGTEYCVFNERRSFLFGSFPGCTEILPETIELTKEGVFGEFPLAVGGEHYLASYRNLFLKAQFDIQDWSFILAEPRTQILAPMRGFQVLFPPVVLLSLWVVLLLSLYSIRRSLIPLDRLKDGAQRIAERDFSAEVEVTSNDEFDDVARAFNDMSKQLRRHLKSLAANAAIHRAVLSALDKNTIIRTAASGVLEALDCEFVCISNRVAENKFATSVILSADGEEAVGQYVVGRLSETDAEMLEKSDQLIPIGPGDGFFALLSGIPSEEQSAVVALPVVSSGQLEAILFLGRQVGSEFDEEEVHQARQVANQVAVALSNAKLLEELKSMTWGMLEAFARAIDAKSSWTGGHSERVTVIAVLIARKMNFSDTEIENLRRGAMLHDVGKLGISRDVLNKPTVLTPIEVAHIRTHTSVGHRILEPIGTLNDIIPMIKQHHERFDGEGYPDGLAGEKIDLKARILALADAFDAMTSNRPYRAGFTLDVAVPKIAREAGKQFDPEVVRAFLEAVAEDPKPFEPVVQADVNQGLERGVGK